MPLTSDVKPFVLDFDLVSGSCTSGKVKPTQCRVSDMAAQFVNETVARAMVEGGDSLLYEFYGLDLPEGDSGVLQFGTTIFYSGEVGEEYFMTKGRFHIILDTFEIHYGFSGHSMMLMETPKGQMDRKETGPGEAPCIPGRWVHRSINTGTEPLVMSFVYRGDASHDHSTTEKKGHQKLVVE